MNNTPILTFDCDWAPNFIIENIAEELIKNNIKSTWFVTNNSPIIQKLQKNPLFELGIHPNFESDSTQGKNFEDIMKNLLDIVPDAKSIRTHRLLQSSTQLKKYQKYGIENDVTLYLPNTPNLQPHYSEYYNLTRFPFFWEDDIEMKEEYLWSLSNSFFHEDGLKIFNFHPVHVYLNSRNMKNYEELKKDIGLENIDKKNVEQYINHDKNGARDFLKEIISFLENKETFTIQSFKQKNNLK